jgi:hypothetical protein
VRSVTTHTSRDPQPIRAGDACGEGHWASVGLRVGVDWLVGSFEGEGCTTFGISLGWEEGNLSSTPVCRGTLHDSPHANSKVHAV